jgi:hypothetical protein
MRLLACRIVDTTPSYIQIYDQKSKPRQQSTQNNCLELYLAEYGQGWVPMCGFSRVEEERGEEMTGGPRASYVPLLLLFWSIPWSKLGQTKGGKGNGGNMIWRSMWEGLQPMRGRACGEDATLPMSLLGSLLQAWSIASWALARLFCLDEAIQNDSRRFLARGLGIFMRAAHIGRARPKINSFSRLE